MKEIQLTQGKVALCDDEDFEYLIRFNWHAVLCPDGRSGKYPKWYAARKEGGKRIYMHRDLMGTPAGMVVDHHDDNGLNCQKKNLSNCYQRENARRSWRKKEAVGL